MRILKVSISELEFKKFGFNKKDLSFSELLELTYKQLSKQALKESAFLGKKYQLSSLSTDDISREVKAVRKEKITPSHPDSQ